MKACNSLLAVLALALAAGGCASKSRTTASMGMMKPEAGVLLSLGAGDALGRRVYLNDLVIAARELQGDVAFTAAPETGSIDLGE